VECACSAGESSVEVPSVGAGGKKALHGTISSCHEKELGDLRNVLEVRILVFLEKVAKNDSIQLFCVILLFEKLSHCVQRD